MDTRVRWWVVLAVSVVVLGSVVAERFKQPVREVRLSQRAERSEQVTATPPDGTFLGTFTLNSQGKLTLFETSYQPELGRLDLQNISLTGIRRSTLVERTCPDLAQYRELRKPMIGSIVATPAEPTFCRVLADDAGEEEVASFDHNPTEAMLDRMRKTVRPPSSHHP